MSLVPEPCVFCDRAKHALLGENELAFAIRDKFPVRRLHSLVLPRRHVADTFALSSEEFGAVFALAKNVRDQIERDDPEAAGFNFGSNNGAVAGQKIMHVHFHLIPRRPDEGEVSGAKP